MPYYYFPPPTKVVLSCSCDRRFKGERLARQFQGGQTTVVDSILRIKQIKYLHVMSMFFTGDDISKFLSGLRQIFKLSYAFVMCSVCALRTGVCFIHIQGMAHYERLLERCW